MIARIVPALLLSALAADAAAGDAAPPPIRVATVLHAPDLPAPRDRSAAGDVERAERIAGGFAISAWAGTDDLGQTSHGGLAFLAEPGRSWWLGLDGLDLRVAVQVPGGWRSGPLRAMDARLILAQLDADPAAVPMADGTALGLDEPWPWAAVVLDLAVRMGVGGQATWTVRGGDYGAVRRILAGQTLREARSDPAALLAELPLLSQWPVEAAVAARLDASAEGWRVALDRDGDGDPEVVLAPGAGNAKPGPAGVDGRSGLLALWHPSGGHRGGEVATARAALHWRPGGALPPPHIRQPVLWQPPARSAVSPVRLLAKAAAGAQLAVEAPAQQLAELDRTTRGLAVELGDAPTAVRLSTPANGPAESAVNSAAIAWTAADPADLPERLLLGDRIRLRPGVRIERGAAATLPASARPQEIVADAAGTWTFSAGAATRAIAVSATDLPERLIVGPEQRHLAVACGPAIDPAALRVDADAAVQASWDALAGPWARLSLRAGPGRHRLRLLRGDEVVADAEVSAFAGAIGEGAWSEGEDGIRQLRTTWTMDPYIPGVRFRFYTIDNRAAYADGSGGFVLRSDDPAGAGGEGPMQVQEIDGRQVGVFAFTLRMLPQCSRLDHRVETILPGLERPPKRVRPRPAAPAKPAAERPAPPAERPAPPAPGADQF